MSKRYSDHEIVAAIQLGGIELNRIMRYIYHHMGVHQSVINLIKSKGGSREDGEDVFQDAIRHFIMNVKTGKYKSEGDIKAYIYGISRNLWYNKFRRKLKIGEINLQVIEKQEEPPNPEILFMKTQKEGILNDVMEQIGEICKIILSLWSMKYSFKEIGFRLNKSEGAVRKQKHGCLQKLILFFKQNPELGKEIKSIFDY